MNSIRRNLLMALISVWRQQSQLVDDVTEHDVLRRCAQDLENVMAIEGRDADRSSAAAETGKATCG